jgi:thymidylate kinase
MNTRCPEIARPDLCIYLDLLPEQSLARIQKRGEAVEIYENVEKLTSVRRAFLSVIDDLRASGEKIVVIDAYRPIEQIADEIFAAVNKILFDN